VSFDCIGALKQQELLETSQGTLRISCEDLPLEGLVLLPGELRLVAQQIAECIGCAVCQKICPAKAIEIKDKKAVIIRKDCIRCFCCQEFCPKGAMKVSRPIVAKLAGGRTGKKAKKDDEK
jgi:Fe-S-cluster-containing hydrogenase component 2